MHPGFILPLSLTGIRALLAPLLVVLAMGTPNEFGLGLCLVLALLTDVFDGIIARRLHSATPLVRRLDSIADTVFYVAALWVAWHLHPEAVHRRLGLLLVLGGLELARYAYDFAKFRREASYHMWSSKLWGILLFMGFFALLALGHDGWPVDLAIYAGILCDLEGLAISVVLPRWRADVPSILHALALRGRPRT